MRNRPKRLGLEIEIPVCEDILNEMKSIEQP
jgi:hypothetical protein